MKVWDEYHRRRPDVKEKMATLLIQHQLLNNEDLQRFHQEIQKIVDKYYPLYQKGLVEWFKENNRKEEKSKEEEEKDSLNYNIIKNKTYI